MTNLFAEELFFIMSKSKAQNSINHNEKRVMSSIKKALIKALDNGDNEFDLTLTRNQYGNSPDALEGVYMAFKDVIEDDDNPAFIKLSVTIQ